VLSSEKKALRARLIALIGIDGAGKTTQAARLAQWLVAKGISTELHRNASTLPLRVVMTDIARAQGKVGFEDLVGARTAKLIISALKWTTMRNVVDVLEGRADVVVIDRYSYCQIAGARHFDLGDEQLVRDLFASLPTPDLTLFLDAAPAIALERIEARGSDQSDLGELSGLRAAYLDLPEAQGFTMIDASAAVEDVHAAIRRQVMALLDDRIGGGGRKSHPD
jgi:dTMP kinase